MKIFIIIGFIILLTLTGCGHYYTYPADDEYPATYPRQLPYNEILDPPHTYYLDPVTVEIPPDTAYLPCQIHPIMKEEILPEYPDAALMNRIRADIRVRVFVDEQGIVRKVRIIGCNRPNQGFEEAVIEAVHQCRFYPAQYYNRPVPVWFEYTMAFTPDSGIERNPYLIMEAK